jgi:glycerophosphoryl diester phosphodiesterase
VRLRAEQGRFLVVAHRGVPTSAPENTLAAIEAAFALGVDVVEVDVSLLDGELLLAHSPDVASSESPSLEDALRFFSDRAAPEMALQVDLKARGVEARVVEALERQGLLNRALVSSVYLDVLLTVRRLASSLATGLGYPHDRANLTERRLIPPSVVRGGLAAMRLALPHRVVRMARAAQADVMVLHHAVVGPGTIRRCRERGIAVYVWTVNDRAALERVLDLGVDAVITDDPRLVAGYR